MKNHFNPRKRIWGGILFLHPTVMSVMQVIKLFCEPEKDDYLSIYLFIFTLFKVGLKLLIYT